MDTPTVSHCAELRRATRDVLEVTAEHLETVPEDVFRALDRLSNVLARFDHKN